MAKQDLKKFHAMIMNQFLKDLYDVLNSKDCFNYFAEMMQESIKEEVYGRYNPTSYERRGEDGGLLDKDNYDYKVSISAKGIKIFMKNLTKGVGKAYQIDEGIVKGIDFYDWERSTIYYLQEHGGYPRDFYTYMEVLVEDKQNKLQNIIQKQMKKKGWKTK
jgi:hypothetical protein